jgi:hypothetical protein
MDNLAQPNEQQRANGDWTHSNEREKSKRTYQRVSPLTYLRRRNFLSPEQVQAGEKFEKLYRGALGHDTRDRDTISGDPDVECYQTYCSQALSNAKDAAEQILEFHALRHDDHRGTADRLRWLPSASDGRHLSLRKGRDTCQHYGMSAIHGALEILAEHWGFLQAAQKSRERAA